MSEESKTSLVGVGVAAALGGLAAVMVDLFQKQDASAIYQLTNFVNKASLSIEPTGKYALPVAGVGLLLMVAAMILAFFAEARSARAGFYSGASVLTVLMTLVPYHQPLAPVSGTTVRQMSSWEDWRTVGVTPATFTGTAPMADRGRQLWFAQSGNIIPVTILVHTEGSQPARISGVLYDAVSGRSYRLGYGSPLGTTQNGTTYRFDFAISAGEPKGDRIADLKLRIEAPGFKNGIAAQTVTTAGVPVEMKVELSPSNVPQFLQRAIERPQY